MIGTLILSAPSESLGIRPRLPRVTDEFPPPATVIRLVCPRCETLCRLTDRTVRANYADPDSIAFCVHCFDLDREVIHLCLEGVNPIAREVLELRALLKRLDREQANYADHEALIIFKRRQALRAELEALALYGADVDDPAAR